MNKKIYLIIFIFSIIALLRAVSNLIIRIGERGVTGVNYGIIIFPLLLAIICLYKYIKK